jgi:hypothetical protein
MTFVEARWPTDSSMRGCSLRRSLGGGGGGASSSECSDFGRRLERRERRGMDARPSGRCCGWEELTGDGGEGRVADFGASCKGEGDRVGSVGRERK